MKEITTIRNYPDNGLHVQCDIGLPFEITKGEDSFWYNDKNGKEKQYGNGNKVDARWIVLLSGDSNESLDEIFEVMVNKDLDKIIDYCFNVYKKSLLMEMKRVKALEKENKR